MSGMMVQGGTNPTTQSRVMPAQATQEEQTENATVQRAVVKDVFHLKAKQAKQPSLQEMIRTAQENANQNQKQFTVKKNEKYGDVPIEAYARLSKANTQTDVNAAAGFARRGIARLKAALKQDDDNSERIRAAISQLRKAVVRAGRKKRDLGREALVAQSQERAAAEERSREEQRLKTDLKNRKTQRVLRENGYISEAAMSDRFAAEMALRRQSSQIEGVTPATPTQSVAPTVPLSGSAAVASVVETAMPTEAGFSVQV